MTRKLCLWAHLFCVCHRVGKGAVPHVWGTWKKFQIMYLVPRDIHCGYRPHASGKLYSGAAGPLGVHTAAEIKHTGPCKYHTAGIITVLGWEYWYLVKYMFLVIHDCARSQMCHLGCGWGYREWAAGRGSFMEPWKPSRHFGHQASITKYHFDELRVRESEPDGLNFPWNAHRIKN